MSYISDSFPKLTEIIARQLSCSDRRVEKEDIKINVFASAASYQSADTRIEMYAYPFEDRLDDPDKVCRNIRDYVNKNFPQAGSVDVFLYLNELGYSVNK